MVDRERTKLADYQQQWDTLLDLIVGALIHLSKDLSGRSIMKEMHCPSILIRVSVELFRRDRLIDWFMSSQFVHLPACSLQQSAHQLLKELNLESDSHPH